MWPLPKNSAQNPQNFHFLVTKTDYLSGFPISSEVTDTPLVTCRVLSQGHRSAALTQAADTAPEWSADAPVCRVNKLRTDRDVEQRRSHFSGGGGGGGGGGKEGMALSTHHYQAGLMRTRNLHTRILVTCCDCDI